MAAFGIRTFRGLRLLGGAACDDEPEETAKCISPLAIDGGTAFGLMTDGCSWDVGFRLWLDDLRRPRDEEELTRLRQSGWWSTLPVLQSGAGQLFAVAPVGKVTVSGTQNQLVTWHCPDRAYVSFTRRLDGATGEVKWCVRVQAKARELYADGLSLWAGRWLQVFSDLTESKPWRELPWRTSQLHLNGDFTGLDFTTTDLRNFMGSRSKSFMGVMPDDEEKLQAHEWTSGFYLGRRSSDIELCLYRKSHQLIKEKKVLPAASMYAPTWNQYGWDGEPVWRVEFRLRKHALLWESREAEGGEIDLRNPASLMDREILAKMWARLCVSRRLVIPERTRRRRSATDPRWRVVQGASDQPAPNIRQNRSLVRELTVAERLAKTVGATLKRAAELRGDLGLEGDDFAAAAMMLRSLADMIDANGPAIAKMHDRICPTPIGPGMRAAHRRGKHRRQLAEDFELRIKQATEEEDSS